MPGADPAIQLLVKTRAPGRRVAASSETIRASLRSMLPLTELLHITRIELLKITRPELLPLLRQAANALVTAPEHSPERENALANLRKINRTLAQSKLSANLH